MNCGARESCSNLALPVLRVRRRLLPLRLLKHPIQRFNSFQRFNVYSSFRQFCERLLRIPHDPAPPPGDEASTRIFRAAPNYYRYLLCLWALKAAASLLILLVSIVVPSGIAAFELARGGKTWGSLLWLIPVAVILLHVLSSLFMLAVLRLNFE